MSGGAQPLPSPAMFAIRLSPIDAEYPLPIASVQELSLPIASQIVPSPVRPIAHVSGARQFVALGRTKGGS